MKRIAVFTSGGDSPGMNACIRAVVRTAIYHKIEVLGIKHGYDGMIKGEFSKMDSSSVANIIHRGGTILKTARSKKFLTIEGRKSALANLQKHGINGVVVIGGDGSFRGALEFSEICDIPFVGCPGTIDNDLIGTDFAIGYDTAVNTVVEAVDKIRDTAESHDRLFFVEVMGRDAGLIALRSGISVGAEAIIMPETKTDIEDLITRLESGRKSKSSKIIIVAEGDEAGGAFVIAEQVKKRLPDYDTRVTILGHIQRGGNPSAMDRVNSSRMGFAAIEALLAGKRNVMVGIIDKKIAYTPFQNAVKHHQRLNPDLVRMIDILSL
ncbi:MAG: 6-phosphofructokinase [Bacteroidetes bacterium RIFCSPLOWO2_12_FULL_35_15]|nr:MAG: 6-phosphofructokinase [Bacteroidetes bacterium RIFCSPLOWO2_12_FULL_35_15]